MHALLKKNKGLSIHVLFFQEQIHIQPISVPVENVAFLANIPPRDLGSSQKLILTFDSVLTNTENTVHSHMCEFLVTRSVIYVFIYSQ